MNEVMQNVPMPNVEVREKILSLEQQMREFNAVHHQDAVCPLKHHFAPGAYGREIFLPKDSLVVGKIHKHAHLNMIMTGKVLVATEDGVKHYEAPLVMVSQPGTKRVVYAEEDTIWVTVHLTHSQDLAEIEDEIIAKTYDEYDLLTGIDLPGLLANLPEKESL